MCEECHKTDGTRKVENGEGISGGIQKYDPLIWEIFGEQRILLIKNRVYL